MRKKLRVGRERLRTPTPSVDVGARDKTEPRFQIAEASWMGVMDIDDNARPIRLADRWEAVSSFLLGAVN